MSVLPISEPRSVAESKERSLSLLIVTVIVAGCSIAYELLLAQTLSTLAANTVRWYSLAVGFFLISMGIGSMLYHLVPKTLSRIHLLFWIEIGLISVGSVVVAGVHLAHMLFGYLYVRGYDPSAVFVFLFIPMVLSALIGVLSGFELPILMDLAKGEGEEDAQMERTNEVLAADYFGSLVGSIAFPLVLLAYFHIFEIGIVIASLNFAVACWIAIYRLWGGSSLRWIFRMAVLVGIFAALTTAFLQRENVKGFFLKKYYYYLSASDTLETLFAPMPDMPKITSIQSPYQRIDIVHDPIGSPDDQVIELFSDKLEENPDFPSNRILFLNGDFQTNTLHEEIYHEWFAHVPIILRKKVPNRILVLGGGDGYLLRELVKYDAVEEIVHIDLDPTLVETAQTNPALLAANDGSFSHPKVHTTFRDGFQYVRTEDERFPAIYVDFPLPNDYNLAKLYSVEFYKFVRQMLTDDGFAVFDASGIGLVSPPDGARRQYPDDVNDWPVYYNTIKAAGFEVITPYLSTLGFYDTKLLNEAIRRTDIVPTDIDDAVGLPEQFQLLLRKAAVQKILANYVLSFQQGFMMMGKDPSVFSKRYWKPPVPLRILNALRFHQSFLTDFPTSEEPDWSKVNSIMLPRFPTTGFWEPRLPW